MLLRGKGSPTVNRFCKDVVVFSVLLTAAAIRTLFVLNIYDPECMTASTVYAATPEFTASFTRAHSLYSIGYLQHAEKWKNRRRRAEIQQHTSAAAAARDRRRCLIIAGGQLLAALKIVYGNLRVLTTGRRPVHGEVWNMSMGERVWTCPQKTRVGHRKRRYLRIWERRVCIEIRERRKGCSVASERCVRKYCD